MASFANNKLPELPDSPLAKIESQNTKITKTPSKNLQYVSSARQDYGYDPAQLELARPYDKGMFSSNVGGDAGNKGLVKLIGKIADGNEKTEQSGYAADFSAVHEYN